ncbi:MAG: Gfo/Idh/MocA family oxidoreductase [Deltaproteobacteria bacterium]|nr:Gfo/Idh/MocA family oxidoreductase [Deltaproteobacteria bacterium]
MNKDQNKGSRILIVGCGQLGSRHLQAIASVPFVREIEVVDPRPEALEIGRKLLSEIPERQRPISFRWVTSIEEATKGGDLCIVATQAKGRSDIIFQVSELLGYKNFLIEKIVTQSVADYERLLDFAKRKKLSIWVNCKSRAHPSHKRVKASLKPGEPIVFNISGGNHGLANNGLHGADLFAFYDQTSEIKNAGAVIDPVLHPSKRGPEVFDLTGTLHGYTDKGSQFTLSFSANNTAPAQFSICSPSYRAVVDDAMKWFFESSADTGWVWRQVPYEANLMVSNMTRNFAMDILSKGKCELPTLEECFPAHQFILNALQPHFKKLMKKEIQHCPVT